jgi:hypothetical protein
LKRVSALPLQEAFGTVLAASWEQLPPEQKAARIQQLQLASAMQRGAAVGNYPRWACGQRLPAGCTLGGGGVGCPLCVARQRAGYESRVSGVGRVRPARSTDSQFDQREVEERALAAARARAAAEGGGEEDDEVPYIPPDIYEEQQRLVAEARARAAAEASAAAAAAEADAAGQAEGSSFVAAPAGSAAARGPTGYGATPVAHVAAALAASAATGAAQPQPGDAGAAPLGSGEAASGAAELAAAGLPSDFGRQSDGAGTSGGAPEWELAYQDPETRERMRNDPAFRDRMRRMRSEAVYRSALDAHYAATVSSYGPVPLPGQEGHDPAAYAAWYYYWYGQQGQHEGQGDGEAGGEAAGGGEGAAQGTQAGAAQGGPDGLSLLGAAYGSDDEEEGA